MKKVLFFPAMASLIAFISCNKSSVAVPQISLNASSTQVSTGQTVSVTVSSSLNATRWSVSPAAATQAYSVTTSKTNYFTFSQPGVYTISASARSLGLAGTSQQSLDSAWAHTAGGACTKGIDSASVQISVLK